MIENEIDIPTQDGAMNTFITHPEEGGPFPVVLFYMDAPGKREELHDMARRIATVGYYVLLPNLYYRREREFIMGPDQREAMFGGCVRVDHNNDDEVRALFERYALPAGRHGFRCDRLSKRWRRPPPALRKYPDPHLDCRRSPRRPCL